MNWRKYRKDFISKAASKDLSAESVKHALNYARRLHKKGLPIIYSQRHLSLLIGYKYDYLLKVSNARSFEFYRCYEIPKKSSDSTRLICEPLPNLKEIQRWILDNILVHVDISKFAKAYVIGLSIKDNARFHRGQHQVLRLDVKDFFPSISGKKVYRIFRSLGYSSEVSAMLTGLTVLNDGLPQGAPTSPALSNIYLKRCDARIGGYCLPRKIRYSRYADDMTFSGNFSAGKILSFIALVLSDNDLKLNESKTKIMFKHQRQSTTGLVVNKKINVAREKRRKLRQEVYYIKKYGLNGHLNRTKETRSNYISHLTGIANFILHINANDKDAIEAKKILAEYFV